MHLDYYDKPIFSLFRAIFSILTFVAFSASAEPAFSAPGEPGFSAPGEPEFLNSACLSPRPMSAFGQERGTGEAGEMHCYRLDLTSPGLLQLSVSVAGNSPSAARLDLLGAAPGVILRRSVDERLVLARAGSYFIWVSGEDPARPLPAYRLASRFVAFDKSETDGELEIEAEELKTVCAGGAKSETDGELEIEAEEMRLVCSAKPNLISRLCSASDGGNAPVDDHGDSLTCATRLTRRVVGEVSNGWGDDVDVFRFELRAWRTVEIVAEGGVDTYGTLLDNSGQRLASDDDGGGDGGFRLLRTLAPGTYFVRVEGIAATGRYALSLRDWR